MNERIILCKILKHYVTASPTQRDLSALLGMSVGAVNKYFKTAVSLNYISPENKLTEQGLSFLQQFKVDNAVIFAAGFGSRFVPLTYETPKGLIKVKGTPMLERQIEQLLEAGITDITVMVGYLKEKFEYLKEKYGVKLVYNPDYRTHNTMRTAFHARELFKNSYLLYSDNWIENNMFNMYEPTSWYSCLYYKGETAEWCVTRQKAGRINKVEIGGKDSLAIVGPLYMNAEFSEKFVKLLEKYYDKPGTDNWFVEHIFMYHFRELEMYMNVQTGNVYEFDTLQELSIYDKSYEATVNEMEELKKCQI